jgi:aminomethyltransferase
MGVEWAVDMSKPKFVGREALLRRLDDGVKMRLVGRERGANWPIPRKDDRILRGSKPIGAITNPRYSPTFNMNLARAWTESAHAEKDTRVEVKGADVMYPTRIAHT